MNKTIMAFLDVFHLFCSSWNLYKRYSNPDGSEEFWRGLQAEAEAIYKKYGKTEFVFKVVNATVDEIERIERANDADQ